MGVLFQSGHKTELRAQVQSNLRVRDVPGQLVYMTRFVFETGTESGNIDTFVPGTLNSSRTRYKPIGQNKGFDGTGSTLHEHKKRLYAGGVITDNAQVEDYKGFARYDDETGEWEGLGQFDPMGAKRIDSMASWNGRIAMAGEFDFVGDTNGEMQNIVTYDPETDTFIAVNADSTTNGGFRFEDPYGEVVEYEGELYADGLFSGGGIFHNMCKWNPATNQWNALVPGVSDPFFSNGVVQDFHVFKGKLYIAVFRVIYSWDGSQFELVYEFPFAAGFAIDLDDHQGKLVVMGSFLDVESTDSRYIALLDPDTGEWTALGQGVREQPADAVSIAGTLYACGNHATRDRKTTELVYSVFKFDPKEDRWFPAANMEDFETFPWGTYICPELIDFGGQLKYYDKNNP